MLDSEQERFKSLEKFETSVLNVLNRKAKFSALSSKELTN